MTELSPRMKRLEEAGLLGCFDNTGVNSTNYKGILMDKWIDIRDQLPEFDKKVLAYSLGATLTYICFRPEENEYNEHWSICEASDCSCVGCTAPIDYWMPLPTPPEEQ